MFGEHFIVVFEGVAHSDVDIVVLDCRIHAEELESFSKGSGVLMVGVPPVHSNTFQEYDNVHHLVFVLGVVPIPIFSEGFPDLAQHLCSCYEQVFSAYLGLAVPFKVEHD